MSSSAIEKTFPVTGPQDTLGEFFQPQILTQIGVEHELHITDASGQTMDGPGHTALQRHFSGHFSAEAANQMVELKTRPYEAKDHLLLTEDLHAQRAQLKKAAETLGMVLSPYGILHHVDFDALWNNVYDNPRCQLFLRYFADRKPAIGDYFLSTAGDQISISTQSHEDQWRLFKIFAFLSPFLAVISNNDAPDAPTTSLARRLSTTDGKNLGLPRSFWQAASAAEFAFLYNNEIWSTPLFTHHREDGQLVRRRTFDGLPNLTGMPAKLRTYKNFKLASSIQWSLVALAGIDGPAGERNKGRRIELRCIDSQSDPNIQRGLIALCAAIATDSGVTDRVEQTLHHVGFDMETEPMNSWAQFAKTLLTAPLSRDYAKLPYGNADFDHFCGRITPTLQDIHGAAALADMVEARQSPFLRRQKLAMG